MKKLLWVGDSPTVATGFGRATQYIVEALRPHYEIEVLGMHYRGDPHKFPYEIWPTRWDILGARRLPERCEAFKPDVIVLQNDVWNIPYYMKELWKGGITTRTVAALAIDGKNCQADMLDGVSMCVFWTEFAKQEAELGGWTGPSAVIPLGIDLEVYQPPKIEHIKSLREHARTFFQKIPGTKVDLDGLRNGFVVGNVNRNQQRKRLDLTVAAFCEWVHAKDIKDAYLTIQACPTGEQEYDITQLMAYYGLADRLYLIYPDIEVGIPEKHLVWMYRSFDVQMTTTQGEGFGLTTFEGMACGIPQIVPDWAALGELCGEAALKVPCNSIAATQKGVNAIGGVADLDKLIAGLDLLYRRPELREELSRRGLDLVKQDRFRWSDIGERYHQAIEEQLFPSNDPWMALTEA